MSKQNTRAHGWVFTINNYNQQDEQRLKQLHANGTATYVTYGREVAPGTGTRHLQGCIQFAAWKSRRQASKLLGGCAFLEIRNGSPDQAAKYCHKEDADYEELGRRPLSNKEKGQAGGQAEKARWATILKEAKAGNIQRLETSFPREFIQLKPRLLSLREPERKPINGELPHEWWMGATGTGKSRLAWELYPNHYAKQLNKWWDGYTFEDVVIIEEWSPKNECTASFLKIWADRYPFNCEVKGAMLPSIRPKKIIVLSNYTIDQCFPRSEDSDPLKRRFKVIPFPKGELHARARLHNYVPTPTETSGENEQIERAELAISPSHEEPLFNFNFNTEELDEILASTSPSSITPYDFDIDGAFAPLQPDGEL